MMNCLCFEELMYRFPFFTYILLSFFYIQALLMTKHDIFLLFSFVMLRRLSLPVTLKYQKNRKLSSNMVT